MTGDLRGLTIRARVCLSLSDRYICPNAIDHAVYLLATGNESHVRDVSDGAADRRISAASAICKMPCAAREQRV